MLAWLGVALLTPAMAGAEEGVLDLHPWLRPLVTDHGFTATELNRLLSGLESYPTAVWLMDRQAEAKPYHEYRQLFITSRFIQQARKHWRRHWDLLNRVERELNAPPSVVVTLWGIESHFGGNMGNHPILRVLFTLATRYPRRAAFFQEELKAFLLVCREEGWRPEQVRGSYAGAFGQVQMIPSTFRKHAVDFNGDGKRDVFAAPPDVLASIASFLAGNGWKKGGLYTQAVITPAYPASRVTPSLDAMRPWSAWHEEGFRLVNDKARPELNEPAALIMLEGKDGPSYHMAFENFRVVTRWNNSRRFAMVVGEIAEQLEHAA